MKGNKLKHKREDRGPEYEKDLLEAIYDTLEEIKEVLEKIKENTRR